MLDPAFGVIVLGAGQLWIGYRLAQQDRARNAARSEIQDRARVVKLEVTAAADEVREQVESAALATVERLDAIHGLVNGDSRAQAARIRELEKQLRER